MAKAEGTNSARPGQGKRATAKRSVRTKRVSNKAALWGVTILIAVGASFFAARGASASHPEPRQDAHTHHVASPSRYASYPRVAATYTQAAEIKEVLDGVYCYCNCSQHSGHYSLLDCFKDDHAARCDICLSEAALAHRMHGEGASLEQIRDAVDGMYGL